MSMTIFDIITIGGGVLLLVAPKWAYNFGRKEPVEVTPKAILICRVAGVIFIALGAFFIILQMGGGAA